MGNISNKSVKNFIQVPTMVLHDSEISPNSKLIFGIILSLTRKRGYCYASNSTFSSILNRHNNAISRSISQLSQYGYLQIQYVNQKRRIYISLEVLTADIKLC